MSKQVLSIGLTVIAAASSLAALPVITNAANTGANASEWAERVENFETVRSQMPADSLAANMAMLHAVDATLTSWQRDNAMTDSIEKLDASLLVSAENASQQKQCLSEALYYEARSETYAGQKAVGEVVMNRVASKHFPDTVCGVIYEGAERSTGCQFSFTCDGSMDSAPNGKAWTRAKMLADHILIGAHKPATQNATHYHTTDINPHWASYVKPTRTIGSHKFYKFKTRRELAMSLSVAP